METSVRTEQSEESTEAVQEKIALMNRRERRSRGMVHQHGKKWWGNRKATPSSFHTHVVLRQRGSSGKMLNFRFPRENYEGTK